MLGFFFVRDLNKIAQVQQVEAATAEERLLNMDFMKNKSRDLTYRNKIAQVCLCACVCPVDFKL